MSEHTRTPMKIETWDDLRSTIARLTAERDEWKQKATTIARVNHEWASTCLRARVALQVARDAIKREAWQDGPTISNAETKLGEAIDMLNNEITVEGAENQLKLAARKALEFKAERDTALAQCKAWREAVEEIDEIAQDPDSYPYSRAKCAAVRSRCHLARVRANTDALAKKHP